MASGRLPPAKRQKTTTAHGTKIKPAAKPRPPKKKPDPDVEAHKAAAGALEALAERVTATEKIANAACEVIAAVEQKLAGVIERIDGALAASLAVSDRLDAIRQNHDDIVALGESVAALRGEFAEWFTDRPAAAPPGLPPVKAAAVPLLGEPDPEANEPTQIEDTDGPTDQPAGDFAGV